MLSFLAAARDPGRRRPIDLDGAACTGASSSSRGAPGVIEVWDEPERWRIASPRPPSRLRRAGAPARECAPAVRSRRRTRRSSMPRSRSRSVAATAGAGAPGRTGTGRARSVRGERARRTRTTGLGAARRPGSPDDSSSGSELLSPESARSGSPTSFPTPRPSPTADLTEVGLTRARARAVNGLAAAVASGDARRCTAPATSITRSPSWSRCPDSGPGPPNTSQCGRAANATRSPRPTSGYGARWATTPRPAPRPGDRGGRTERSRSGSVRPRKRSRSGLNARDPGIRQWSSPPHFPWSDLIFQLEIASRVGYD